MSSSQLLPRMKRELEILERDIPPGIVCYPIDDSFMRFCAQIKGPKDTPYEEGTFKVDVQIPARYPLEPPKMQFITPIYHPNIDDAGRICLDLLKMPPNGSWKPSLNISTTLTSLSLLMAEPNPDDPLVVEIASEYKELRSLFLHKAREATLKYAVESKESHYSKNIEKSEISKSTENLTTETYEQNDLQEKSMFKNEDINSASKNEDIKPTSKNEMSKNEELVETKADIPEISRLTVNDSQQQNPKPFSTQNRKRRFLLRPKSKGTKKISKDPTSNFKPIDKRKPFGDLSNQNINKSTTTTSLSSSSETKKQFEEKNIVEQRKPFGDLSNQSIINNNNLLSEINEPLSENQTTEQKKILDDLTNQNKSDISMNQGLERLETKLALNIIKSQIGIREPFEDITQHIHNTTNTIHTTPPTHTNLSVKIRKPPTTTMPIGPPLGTKPKLLRHS
ncbi:7276_t:CDS:2 [Diversispora eburnea]|uniref:E2 ubiquitin-conjugating enzyme n=1 Tax=Diversispora eburnea TaxID=1213867 RepID=A0A9N8VGG0_9GLOM|nr:7276_t:CDS:2 [Diversispora eburnea]